MLFLFFKLMVLLPITTCSFGYKENNLSWQKDPNREMPKYVECYNFTPKGTLVCVVQIIWETKKRSEIIQ